MFKIAPKDELKVKVKVLVAGDLGRQQEADFTATWQRLDAREADQLMQQLDQGEIEDRDIVDQYLRNVEGCLDVNGNELPYNDELVDNLMNMIDARVPLIQSFVSTLVAGGKVQRQGNSGKRANTGR